MGRAKYRDGEAEQKGEFHALALSLDPVFRRAESGLPRRIEKKMGLVVATLLGTLSLTLPNA